MAVAFSHDAYDGSYSGLNAMRRLIFELAGYGESEPAQESDGLYPLWDMDDTQGQIESDALPPLANQLRQLVADHPTEVDQVFGPPGSPPEWGTYREVLLKFAEGCERAHHVGEDLTWI